MKQVTLSLDPEASDRVFAVLVSNGIPARFVSRGAEGDVIAVPSRQAPRVRRLIDGLSR
jgi:hypothetical protein